MLEFQEGFFEQEVRDGFYLDVTIKTLWASEMELLNKIAEVCAKYEIQWYAAYGTLLGAIRHEGFVPWDDDMDIWVMRKDYNKLMKVLQNELPEDYHVRSPQTETGYDQFHTCVNNGSGISIAKKWLEANHNCPFTVGIDIFPLDYLPRNKKDRELQKSIFTLVGRVAQVAKNIGRGDYDGENPTMSKAEAIDQVKEGLKYLKKNYKFKLDMDWIKNDEWGKIASEVWKWGNYVASMYGEEESDYIVEYLDWARWDWKKFPKEWFSETYSATFENFMLPIPCGYDNLLRVIYGEYMHFIPKIGCHEYPFYARQLRQLRQYVKDVENRAENVGIISIDDVKIKETHEIPENLIPYTLKEDGSKKKIILMANDLNEYIAYGAEAMDKLENTLGLFKSVKDEVLLWWRPHSMLGKILEKSNPELCSRYQDILTRYKQENWGICDETDDVEVAIEACDAYYGEMNAIVQNVQNHPKPVMLSLLHNEEYAADSNRLRKQENRAFISAADTVEVDDTVYFANTNYNSLVCADKNTGLVKKTVLFDDMSLTVSNMHERCVLRNGKILFLPVGSENAHIYNIAEEQITAQDIAEYVENAPKNTWEYLECGEDVYLLSCCAKQGLWKWDAINDKCVKEDWWCVDGETETLIHGKIDGEKFCTLIKRTNIVYLTDIAKKEYKRIILPDDDITNIAYDGESYWYTVAAHPEIVRWNAGTGKKAKYSVDNFVNIRPEAAFLSINFVAGRLLATSQDGNTIYEYNAESDGFETVCSLGEVDPTFTFRDKTPFFKNVDGKIRVYVRNMNAAWDIDESAVLHTIAEADENDNDLEKLQYKIMIEREVLLFEDGDRCDLNLFL